MCSDANCINPKNAPANKNPVNNTSQNEIGIIQQDPTHILCRAISRMSLQPQSREASGVSDFIQLRHVLRHQLLDSPCGFAINIDETIALRTGEALMDLIKLATYLISNNVAQDTGIGPLIISICQLPTNRNVLEHLLKQKHPTIQAFAEGLLHYASEANDADLVRVLIRRGIDPNSNCGTCWAIGGEFKPKFWYRSRLLCAISSSSSDAAVALLEAGADEKRLDFDGSSCLMMCYQQNLIPLASELLQRGADITVQASPRGRWSPLPKNAISSAVLYGGLPAVRTLTEHDPLVFRNMIHADTSGAFIMAASVGNEAVVQFFLGCDISLSDCGTGLCGAAANGKIQMVKLLLSHGVNVDGSHGWIWHSEDYGWVWRYCNISALEAALGSGQLAVARLLLEHRANIEIKPSVLNKLCWKVMDHSTYPWPDKLDDPDENVELVEPSELARLAESGELAERVELAELLLQAGAKPDEATLVWLSLAGAADPVRRLIERGAHPSTSAAAWGTIVFRTPRLLSVLAAALYTGNDDLASFLLQRGADVNIPAGIEGHMSPLAASICCGRLDWAKELIRRGADSRDPIALWAAAHTDSVDAYHLICSACTNTHGRSVAEFARFAASEAIIRGNLAFLRTIIDNGIHLNAPALPWKDVRYWGWNISIPNDPLLCAVGNANIDAIQLLLDNGADPNRAHLDDYLKDGSMPILSHLPHRSSSSVLCSIAGTLINAGARINFSEPTSYPTPLVKAVAILGSVAVLDLLILNGGHVDAVSSMPCHITTPLCEAVYRGSYKIVRKLLAESARVFGSPRLDARPTVRTVIQIAAQKGHLDMLKLLLEAGEDGSQFISEYPLTLRLAYRSGHRAIAHYLQSYRIETFGHLSCDTDKEILMDIEDERRDTKYWFKFWEDERYSGWKLLASVCQDPEAFAFISKLSDDTLTGSDDRSLNGCDNSVDTSDNASEGNDGNSNIDTNLLRVSNEENTVLCAEDVDGKTKSVNDLTDIEWQEFLNFDVDQSYPMPDRGSCAMDSSIEVLAEETPTEPTCQPVGPNILTQFINSNGFDASQIVAESPDWMSVLDGDTPFMLWEQNGDENPVTDLNLDLWPYSL